MKPRMPWHHKDVLQGMYLEQKLSLREIAHILNTTPSSILYWIRKFEIPTRSFEIGSLNRGKQLSDIKRNKLSQIAKERFADPQNHPMTGHKHSEESKKKMSETKRLRKLIKEQGE